MRSLGEGTWRVERCARILRAVGEGVEDFRHYVAGLCAMGRHSSGIRAANAAIVLCFKCELLRQHAHGMEWRMARAAAKEDRPGCRTYAAEGHLAAMGRNVRCGHNLAVLGMAALSLGYFGLFIGYGV